jgi:hypothetical protein
MSANTTVTANYAVPVTTYTLTVNSTNPASGVAIGASPADNNSTASGNTSFTLNYNSGSAVILTAPATATGGVNTFSSWTGCTSAITVTCNVTLSANATVTANFTIVKTTPTVTLTPASLTIATTQPLTVTVAVSGSNSTPTGSVVLTSGSYTSSTTTLSSGSAQIDIPANSLTAGSDTLKATYTPDATSSSAYNSASGTSSAVTVITSSTVTVSTPSSALAVTDQLLGMNMAYWYDQSNSAILPAFKTAGIKAMRWPGGSGSDDYHWANNTLCEIPTGGTTLTPTALWYTTTQFANVVTELITPGALDVALTANYGTDATCTGPGDPAEAAAWVAEAKTLNANVTHVTVGNEQYGSWEEDLHTVKNDATTYAAATKNGYYPQIKAVDSSVLVGVSVNPGNSPSWDPIVLANAPYDFVEYHYYPQSPGYESDTYLVQKAAQGLTTNINSIKAELTTAGKANTPIYVGEIGSVYTLPGRQSSSITQALYAGQVLGELMNDGVSRATWWIGFGGCDDTTSYQTLSNGTKQYANFDTSGLAYQTDVYGWQDYGGYMVFSDGLPEYGCTTESLAAGTLLPTARAFQLFSKVAVTGESVLTASVAGDTTDVVAYAATHNSGKGTALVLFNRNETASKPVEITLSGQSSATTITVETYDKAIYAQTDAVIPVWADPVITTISAPTLPLTLMLTPWSMNVVIIQ